MILSDPASREPRKQGSSSQNSISCRQRPWTARIETHTHLPVYFFVTDGNLFKYSLKTPMNNRIFSNIRTFDGKQLFLFRGFFFPRSLTTLVWVSNRVKIRDVQPFRELSEVCKLTGFNIGMDKLVTILRPSFSKHFKSQ